MRLADLAEKLNVTFEGNGDAEISGVAGIEHAGPGDLTFVANPKYAALAKRTAATAVLVEPGFATIDAATLRTSNPYLAFAHAIELFHPAPHYPAGIHVTAAIHDTAVIGPEAHIGAYAVVAENVRIGAHATLLAHTVIYAGVEIGDHFFAHAHAVVRESCRVGSHVTLQNGVIVGGDGFGFAKLPSGEWHKIRQSGPAVIEDHVEIQANACIDRASVGETRIARGARIDNLVQVGHGSYVGENTLLCAQVGLAGSTHVGKNVILAGQVGVAGHCVIGEGAIATAQSGIPNDVPPGAVVSGYPAIDNRKWLRAVAVFNRLPELMRTLRTSKSSE